jgi:hypothetical protein
MCGSAKFTTEGPLPGIGGDINDYLLSGAKSELEAAFLVPFVTSSESVLEKKVAHRVVFFILVPEC